MRSLAVSAGVWVSARDPRGHHESNGKVATVFLQCPATAHVEAVPDLFYLTLLVLLSFWSLILLNLSSFLMP